KNLKIELSKNNPQKRAKRKKASKKSFPRIDLKIEAFPRKDLKKELPEEKLQKKPFQKEPQKRAFQE
ncbi:hypothetical protein BpHYR1_019341, partial [Brachionus plicatilis]